MAKGEAIAQPMVPGAELAPASDPGLGCLSFSIIYLSVTYVSTNDDFCIQGR